MKIKCIYKVLLVIVAAVFFTECTEESIDNNSSNSKGFVLQLSLQDGVAGRAAGGSPDDPDEPEDEYGETTEPGKVSIYENSIRHFYLYVFDSNNNLIGCDNQMNLKYDIEKTQDIVVTNPDLMRKIDSNTKYNLYVVANSDNTADSWDGLHTAVCEGLDPSNIQQGKGVLMTAVIKNVQLKDADGNGKYISGVILKRASAKIRIHVKYSNAFTTDVNNTSSLYRLDSNLTGELCNYANTCNLIEEGTGCNPATCKLIKSSTFANVVANLQSVDTCDIEYYCYPNDWNYDNKRETYVILKRPIKKTTGENIENNYYKIPLSYRLPEDIDSQSPVDPSSLYMIKRNHIYDVTVLIDRLGSTSEDKPVEVPCNYSVKDWSIKDVDVTVKNFNWFWVKDKVLYMNNVGSIKTQFDSSYPNLNVTVSDIYVYNTTTAWDNDGEENPTVTIPNTQNGDITISSKIPDNFVGKSFKVTITPDGHNDLAQTIQVYQFPSLYITAQASSSKNGTIYGFKSLMPNMSALPSNADGYELDDRINSAIDVSNYLKTNAIWGYPQTIENGNVRSTVETEENSKLVSPHFVLASQVSTTISDYNNAKSYCSTYSESVSVDNSVQTYGAGTWRVPTKAELYLIDLLQNTKKSLVKKILEGEYYIYTKNPTDFKHQMIDSRISGTAVRCVHDIR